MIIAIILVIYILCILAAAFATILAAAMKHAIGRYKVNAWKFLNTLWHLCLKPQAVLNDKYWNYIRTDIDGGEN